MPLARKGNLKRQVLVLFNIFPNITLHEGVIRSGNRFNSAAIICSGSGLLVVKMYCHTFTKLGHYQSFAFKPFS